MPSNLLPVSLALIYAFFLLWHEPWWRRRLVPGEARRLLEGRYEELSPAERDAFQAFMDRDDGRPFAMINLLQYRRQASYPEGRLPNGSPQGQLTGREAGRKYERMVVPELLKRGCYPVLVCNKLQNFLAAGDGTDFFEQLAVVRYRSRRDLLEMVMSHPFLAGVPHKWASLEKTVAVPSRLMLLVDLRTIVLLVLFTVYGLSARM